LEPKSYTDFSLNGHGRNQNFRDICGDCSKRITSEITSSGRSSMLSIQSMLTSRVMLALVSAPPFSQFPLHIRCFTEYAHAFLTASPSPHDVILDLGGVSGSTGRESTPGATSRPIDVSDHEFRSTHWDKWCEIRESQLECGVCRAKVDQLVRDQYSKC
jgi:hypothetical protein